jgi:predicted TIM-barrel fold metal-dependent hydrolase
MKTIAIEEHFKIPAIIEANSGGAQEKAFKLFGSTGIYSTGEDGEVPAGSLDIGLKRLAAMDAGGIDIQVLSLNQPAAENLEPELAVKLAAMANDKIAAAVTAHPTRFGGFATLPMPDPEASAAELERMVTNHSFVGALIHGHIRGRYLDDQFFWLSRLPKSSTYPSIYIRSVRHRR